MPRESVLVRAFVELTDTLVDDFDVVDLLTVLSDRCLDVLDVEAAGVVLVGLDGELRVMASSSDAMHLLELFEIQAQEGPCLDCCRTGEPVLNEELVRNLDRWPRFGEEARRAGFRTVHVLPLRLRGTVIGALNMFNTELGQMQPTDTAVAQALADVATIAVLQHRAALEAQILDDQLTDALNTRMVIEEAKRLVAERADLTMEQSFNLLRGHARRRNLRLVDVARSVIDGEVALSELDPTL